MGCFGYICKGCGTPVRGDCQTGGENAIMIHVRHGVEKGRVEGHYDEYGRVIEEKEEAEDVRFRGDGDGINRHSEICKSDYSLLDSYNLMSKKRMYNGESLDYLGYIRKNVEEDVNKSIDAFMESEIYTRLPKEDQEDLKRGIADAKEKGQGGMKIREVDRLFRHTYQDLVVNFAYDDTLLNNQFYNLPRVKLDAYSGVAVWHKVCYTKATEAEQGDLTPSENDVDQSWGEIRECYK